MRSQTGKTTPAGLLQEFLYVVTLHFDLQMACDWFSKVDYLNQLPVIREEENQSCLRSDLTANHHHSLGFFDLSSKPQIRKKLNLLQVLVAKLKNEVKNCYNLLSRQVLWLKTDMGPLFLTISTQK